MSETTSVENTLVHKNYDEPNYATTSNNNNLDKDAFLKILTIQLSNQDPLNPIEDKEFISQMAQFTSLEQMQEMNEKLEINSILLNNIDLSIAKQNESIKTQNENFENLKTNQSESLENELEMINQLINLNKALEGYNIGSEEGAL